MKIINLLELLFISIIILFSSDGFVNEYTKSSNIYSKDFSIIEIYMILLIFIYIIYMYINNIRISIKNICFKNLSMIFIVFYGIAVSFFYSTKINISMSLGYPYRLYILSFIMAFFMIQIPRDINNLKNMKFIMILVLCIKDIIGLFKYFFYDGYIFGFLGKVVFPFTDVLSNNVIMFGYCFLMLMIKKRIKKQTKIFYFFACLLSIIVIMYSLKRTSMGLLIVCILFVILISNLRKKLIAIFFTIILFISTGVYIINDTNPNDNIILIRISSLNFMNNKESNNVLLADNGHLDDTLDAIDNIKKNPIFGRGIYTDADRIRVIWQSNTNFFHNGFLMTWNQDGIIGLIIYLLFFYRIIKLALKNYKYLESKFIIIFIIIRIAEQFTLGSLITQSSIIILTNIIIVMYQKFLVIQGDKK